MKIFLFKSIDLTLSALLAAGVLAVGCGDDDSGNPADSGRDVNTMDVSVDTGPADTGVDSAVPPPKTTDECKTMVASVNKNNALSDCMCENCLTDFGACIVNTYCESMVECAFNQKCNSATCALDPVCSLIISEAGSKDSAALGTALKVSTCQTSKCASLTPGIDSGT